MGKQENSSIKGKDYIHFCIWQIEGIQSMFVELTE